MDGISLVAMKRWIFKLFVFLLLGAVVNVAIAWGCAMWSPVGLPETRADLTEDYPGFGYTRHAEMIEMIGSYAPSMSDPFSAIYDRYQISSFNMFLISHASAGWPLRCLKCDVNPGPYIPTGSLWPPEQEIKEIPNETNFWKYGIPSPPSLQWFSWSIGRELPLRPIWPGFAINTIFYAVIVWFMTLGPFVLRRHVRNKRGLCIKCGYDLRGVEHEVCPECGTA